LEYWTRSTGATALDEILINLSKAKELLRQRPSNEISDAEYREQCASYVVGNAFDVFSDSEIVNWKLLEEISNQRRQVAG
jgi:hypothetical protein